MGRELLSPASHSTSQPTPSFDFCRCWTLGPTADVGFVKARLSRGARQHEISREVPRSGSQPEDAVSDLLGEVKLILPKVDTWRDLGL
ncbi:hypothetical protein CRG98_025682 [Punica granatum]|uniref:Uncharacterized protein n=1 Tax=Punica granatum TaxID=22663 RepID=A0A2I0JCA8_PUNGR|nr:hypothetical protein CRG98_025682 [Punica granatum]